MIIAIAAGGTGGHIFPALAVADALKREHPEVEVFFVGAGKEIEKKLIGATDYELETVPFLPVLGKGVTGLLKLLILFPKALFQAIALYRRRRPNLVIGFGGYPSFVPFFAAWLIRIPRVLHEQNVKVGLANKALSVIANKLYSVRNASGFWSKKEVTQCSNPVRESFEVTSEWSEPKDGEAFTILVIGGSQGAVSLNDAILSLLTEMSERDLRIVHQTGERDYQRVKDAYTAVGYSNAEILPFIDDIAARYESAQLIISRAGAMSAAEVAAAGRPAIFVPLSIAGGHQAENVRYLVEQEAACMVLQNDDLAEKLRVELFALLDNHDRLEKMAKQARLSSHSDGLSAAALIAQGLVSMSKQKTELKP